MKVGWIGLGSIGSQMAQRVLGAGHSLVAYARGDGQVAVREQGGGLSEDYGAIAADCDVLGICLFSDTQVRATLIDSGALLALQPGAVLMIHTTGSPLLARELEDLAPPGVKVVDACFSGGPREAADGQLTIMVGGTADAIASARPVMSCYAAQICHVGPLGSGQTVKLLNNLLFAANLKNAAEIMALATAQGLDPMTAASVIQLSSGSSMAMGQFVHASPKQMMATVWPYLAKDVGTLTASAEEAGLDLTKFAEVIRYFSQRDAFG